MSQLKWDKTDFIECLEVIPEVEDYDVSYTYNIVKSGIHLTLKVWHLESIIELSLKNAADENTITSFSILIRGEAEYIKSKETEFLLFRNSLVLPSRFSYLDLGGVNKLESSDIGYNIKLSVNPTVYIEYLRENT